MEECLHIKKLQAHYIGNYKQAMFFTQLVELSEGNSAVIIRRKNNHYVPETCSKDHHQNYAKSTLKKKTH